jgi:hypothetical protein
MFQTIQGKKCNVINFGILSNGVNEYYQDFKYKIVSFLFRVVLAFKHAGLQA